MKIIIFNSIIIYYWHFEIYLDFGRLFTFGSNKFGQLGVGDYKIHSGLNLVAGPLVGFHVTNAACGDTFTVCSTSGILWQLLN